MEFFQSVQGKRFYESTAPRIAQALEEIASEMKRKNDIEQKIMEEVLKEKNKEGGDK